MSPLVELVLLGVGIVAAATSLTALVLERRRRRPNLAKLERLKGRPDDPGAVPPPVQGRVRRWLLAAGLGLSPALFAALLALVGLAAFGLLWGAGLGLVVAGLGGLAAPALPWIAVSTLRWWRGRRIEQGLAYAVSYMVGALRAGVGPAQAWSSAAEASQDPVRREFLEVAERLRLGMSLERALKPLSEGYESTAVRLLVQTMLVKWPAGGDLAPVLDKVARTIRERLRLRWRLRSQLAGARLASVLAALIPYVILPLYLWLRPDWVDRLLSDPLGVRLLVAAILVQIAGFIWVQRQLRVEL